MDMRRGLTLGVVTLFLAGTAYAVAPPTSAPPAEVPMPTDHLDRVLDPGLQRQMTAQSAPLAAFNDRHGEWHVAIWNELTGVPQRAFGEPISLVNGFVDEAAVVAGAEQFLRENEGFLGASAEDLEFMHARQRRGTYYVFFQQHFGGVPVEGGEVFLRVDDRGRLVGFGSTAHPDVAVAPWPALSENAARDAALSGLSFDPSQDRAEVSQLVILPVPWESTVGYFLTYQVEIDLLQGEAGYVAYVDASNGEVIHRRSTHTHLDFPGDASGDVVAEEPTGPQFEAPLGGLRVYVNGGSEFDHTNADGEFNISYGGTDTRELRARFLTGNQLVNVNNNFGADALIVQNVTAGDYSTFHFDNSNSLLEERVPFRTVDLQRRQLTEMDPSFPFGVSVVSVQTNVTSGNCNANWSGSSMNLYYEGGGCIRMGQIPSVSAHEYGHGLSYWNYGSSSLPCPLIEAFPDQKAFFHTGVATIGTGWRGPGTFIRTGENQKTWAQAVSGCPTGGYSSGECHCKADVTMGAIWKTRARFIQKYGETVGDDLAERLQHFAIYSRPTTPQAYLIDLLQEDDTDGNLNNGSPNWAQICEAFDIHGLPCPTLTEFITINHTPLGDQVSETTPYDVVAVITATGDVVDTDALTVTYRVTEGDWFTVSMSPTGNPDEYVGEIPAQDQGNYIEYYISAAGEGGAEATSPPEAPYFGVYLFGVGAMTAQFDDDVESDQGWTLGVGGDTATDGYWVRDDPVGSFNGSEPANPEDDATTGSGVNCYFTGQGVPGGPHYNDDVDGGCTTLLTPVFNLSGSQLGEIRYERWFYNSATDDDALTIEVSSDGGSTWQLLNEIQGLANEWTEDVFRLKASEYDLTSNMLVRFTACDEGGVGTVEAAVDEFVASKLTGGVVDVEESGAPVAGFLVHQNQPNPFNPRTTIRFDVPSAARTSVRIFNVSGQLVRTLVDGPVDAGSHSVVWDGVNDAGVSVASGSYFYKVVSGGFESLRKMTLLK